MRKSAVVAAIACVGGIASATPTPTPQQPACTDAACELARQYAADP